ncbi:sugar phosphate isomerase/epimerase family protein [Cohnella cholangitidis]|uniref:Sugar phosphate isomerase/epimerase n=1 Tax=Cohnella cholangitidis TaxID=2598458 RepID=A0A7G5BW33_9BACL|nr:TIM barrel protein [Cohnella cholangitidis]QMV41167.1 sugar phosphate isomerase/epimerase [Cohnella cholangitidis]
MSWWTMTGVEGDHRPWSLEERFHRIAEAGFDGINGFLPSPEEADTWRNLLDRYGLSFSVNAYPKSAEDMISFLDKAQTFGNISFINAQVMTPFLIGSGAEKLIAEMTALSRDAGIPIYIETHRGTITQDLLRTVHYVERIDDLRLSIDFSHYVLAGEMLNVTEEAEALLQKLLTRTSSIHARVSNGEQIQVDVGVRGEHPMMRHFERWWKSGMTHWLNDVEHDKPFPFICELGPPPYAITLDEYGKRQRELGDRWTQSLLFAETARAIWSSMFSGR